MLAVTKNKPFCDGSHNGNFDHEALAFDLPPKKVQKLVNKLEYNKIGYDLNPDGTVVENPNNPFNQNKIPTRDEPVDGEEKEVENGFITCCN